MRGTSKRLVAREEEERVDKTGGTSFDGSKREKRERANERCNPSEGQRRMGEGRKTHTIARKYSSEVVINPSSGEPRELRCVLISPPPPVFSDTPADTPANPQTVSETFRKLLPHRA